MSTEDQEHVPNFLLVAAHSQMRHHRRLVVLLIAFSLFTAALSLVLYALGDNISYYRTPLSISQSDRQQGAWLRLGGFVVPGSVRQQGHEIVFALSDDVAEEQVRFQGVVPNLFREGQAVVVEGRFEATGGFVAQRLLAKHDERYLSQETVQMLKNQGKWQEYLKQ